MGQLSQLMLLPSHPSPGSSPALPASCSPELGFWSTTPSEGHTQGPAFQSPRPSLRTFITIFLLLLLFLNLSSSQGEFEKI